MEKQRFKAYVIEEKDGNFIGEIKAKQLEELPEGDLLIKVYYSSLNYKDALSASGNKGVTKNYPHTPGIDAVGKVVQSNNADFSPDDEVIVTSYDLGMNTDGGFGQYIRVPASWAVRLPKNMSMKEAMIYGTAGLTAGMSVYRLTELVKPDDGKIVVSGATGGVGSMSVAMLSKLGYTVAAITGKTTEHEYLRKLGATEIIDRNEIGQAEKKPITKAQFAGAIDTVGGAILENIIKSTAPMGVVTACGNVGSPKIELTVFPFILRGVTLIGIDSQNYPMHYRNKVWGLLADSWKPGHLAEIATEITLEQLPEKIDLMLQGQVRGRVVVKMSE
ncbi:YhdH/YhfP family quinone oxidoreductase [Salinivirga cyanobacteriivorans]